MDIELGQTYETGVLGIAFEFPESVAVLIVQSLAPPMGQNQGNAAGILALDRLDNLRTRQGQESFIMMRDSCLLFGKLAILFRITSRAGTVCNIGGQRIMSRVERKPLAFSVLRHGIGSRRGPVWISIVLPP
jgi:hypothetical protein